MRQLLIYGFKRESRIPKQLISLIRAKGNRQTDTRPSESSVTGINRVANRPQGIPPSDKADRASINAFTVGANLDVHSVICCNKCNLELRVPPPAALPTVVATLIVATCCWLLY